MKKITAVVLLLFNTYGFSQSINSSQTKIKKARKTAKVFLRQHHIPGMSISVSQHGNIIWSKGFGFTNKKPRTKVKPSETIFRIASISKSITAFALAKLVRDKIINLDTSIYKYTPDFPKKKYDFTVRQLGGNLAGIRHYKDNTEYALNKKMSITEGLEIFKNDSLLFKPGSQYSYSTYGFVLLSEIMQKASNIPFNKYVTNAVFKPLKMRHSFAENSNRITPNKTQFYRTSKFKKYTIAPPVNNEYKIAGGGFLSTSEDIIKFGNEIIFSKILPKKAVLEIITPQKLDTGKNTGYGIGFSIEKSKKETPKYYHTGGGVGASSILLIYPKEALVITVLTNLTGVSMTNFGNQLEAIFID